MLALQVIFGGLALGRSRSHDACSVRTRAIRVLCRLAGASESAARSQGHWFGASLSFMPAQKAERPIHTNRYSKGFAIATNGS